MGHVTLSTPTWGIVDDYAWVGKYLLSLIAADFSTIGALQAVTYILHRKSGSIKEMAQDRHTVTTHH